MDIPNQIILDSIYVDAKYNSIQKNTEYYGLHVKTRQILFRKSPMPNGTQDIGDFLAIVHALAYLKNKASGLPIYSNSETAILWVKNKSIQANIEQHCNSQVISDLVVRALNWLKNNSYPNALLIWDTHNWGKALTGDVCLEPKLAKPCDSQSDRKAPEAQITISGNTYPLKERLKKLGLAWNGNGWTGSISSHEIERVKEVCRDYDLQYVIEGDGFKETRLARGCRPTPSTHVNSVMGEGRFQWAIEETLELENLRREQRKFRKKNKGN